MAAEEGPHLKSDLQVGERLDRPLGFGDRQTLDFASDLEGYALMAAFPAIRKLSTPSYLAIFLYGAVYFTFCKIVESAHVLWRKLAVFLYAHVIWKKLAI